MTDQLARIGIKNPDFKLYTVKDLVKQGIIEKPLDGNHGETHPKGEDFVLSGIPFIMASDINEGQVDYKTCKFIKKKQADSLRKGFARNGDVLLTHKATIGRTAIVNHSESPYIMLTPQVTYYRVKDKGQLNNRYLRNYFESSFFQNTLNLWAGSGATRAYLGITEQQRLPIILPQPHIQKKIAAVLSAYDDLIENNNRRIALLEKMSEEIYREWFVRMRFPGHEKVKFHKGIPVDWDIAPLNNLIKDIIDYRGLTPGKLNSSWVSEGITALSALNVKKGRLIRLEDSKQVSEDLYEKWMRKKLEKQDILLTSEAPLGEVYILMEEEKYVLSQRLFAIKANPNKIEPSYLYLYLLGKIGQHQLASKATGATVGGIRQELLRKIDVLLPETRLQKQFSEIILPILSMNYSLWKKNNLLMEKRNNLHLHLISGKLSVENLGIQFPPSMKEEAEGANA